MLFVWGGAELRKAFFLFTFLIYLSLIDLLAFSIHIFSYICCKNILNLSFFKNILFVLFWHFKYVYICYMLSVLCFFKEIFSISKSERYS